MLALWGSNPPLHIGNNAAQSGIFFPSARTVGEGLTISAFDGGGGAETAGAVSGGMDGDGETNTGDDLVTFGRW